MPNAIAPGYIQIEYTSAYAPHIMTLPVNTITPNLGAPLSSQIEAWDTSLVDWTTMVDALVAEFQPRFPNTVTFDRATLWNQPLSTDLPFFVGSYSVSLVGTLAVPGWAKATQETISARDTAGYVAKLVFLDVGTTNTFDKQVTLVAAGITDLWDVWTSETWGWSSRAGNRPATFIQTSRTLNESLRRAYRMT